MQVGMTEDQGLYNKPSAAVHPEALAAGTLPQYNTSTFMFASRSISLGKRNISEVLEKIQTHILRSVTFSKIVPLVR